MKVSEGAWIIDKVYEGTFGVVCRVFPDGVTCQFGGMTCIRKFENIQLAPMDTRESDFKDMMELALMTKDYEWARQISQQMKEGVR